MQCLHDGVPPSEVAVAGQVRGFLEECLSPGIERCSIAAAMRPRSPNRRRIRERRFRVRSQNRSRRTGEFAGESSSSTIFFEVCLIYCRCRGFQVEATPGRQDGQPCGFPRVHRSGIMPSGSAVVGAQLNFGHGGVFGHGFNPGSSMRSRFPAGQGKGGAVKSCLDDILPASCLPEPCGRRGGVEPSSLT